MTLSGNEQYSGIEVLREISMAALHVRDVQTLLDKVLEILNRRMGMVRGTFTMRHGDMLVIEPSHGLDKKEMRRGRYHLGEGITGQVASTGISEAVPDITRDKRFLNRTGARQSDRRIAFLCVPVIRNEQVVGTLSIDREACESMDLQADLHLLEIIGNLTAEAVELRREQIEEHDALVAENKSLRDQLDSSESVGELIGNSRAMKQVYSLIKQVAPSDATVLIRGGSGTGKELVASAIQKLSTRDKAPYVTLNCATLPENLVESELFGHEKGAFTGALTRRIGRVEAANGGTLFLDEIGDLSLNAQVKLLRFLQERKFSRLGGNDEISTDVRILAATSRNLEELMAEGKFREDLYFRLNIFPISLPDLKERRSDIILLAEHFINKFNIKYNKHIRRLSTPSINMMVAYHWPGNVRELQNCIERAVLTAMDDTIHGYNLPASLQVSGRGVDGGEGSLPDDQADFNTKVASYERELIVEALKRNNGKMSAAAAELGISPRVIHYKIHLHGISPEWYKKS